MPEPPRRYLTLVLVSALGNECHVIDRTTDLQTAIDNNTAWRERHPSYQGEIAIVEIKTIIRPPSAT